LNRARRRCRKAFPPAPLSADPAKPPHHLLKDGQLLAGQADGISIDRELTPDRVEAEIAGFEGYAKHTAWAAQKRLDPGDELGDREGLGQIIVGSRIKTRDPVVDRVARCQDQDREGLSDAPGRVEDGEPVAVGQAEIEDRHVII
jgi:hypothetical protein